MPLLDFGATGPARRVSTLIAAGVMFAGIVFLRFAVASPTEAVLILCVVPIALTAMEFGTAGGLAAATLSFGVTVLYSIVTGYGLGFVGYLSRVGSYYFVGALIGWFMEQRRTLEERHTRWFEMSRDLSCTAGYDGYFKSLNPAWQRTLGYSPQEMMARPLVELVHPDDRERTVAESSRITAEGADSVTFVNRCRTRDGDYRWLEWTSTAAPDERLIYASARDITERKRTEEALREAEERFRTAFENAPIGMALVDLHARLLQVNAALCTLTGLSPNDLLAKTLLEITYHDDRSVVDSRLSSLRNGDSRTYGAEHRLTHSDGYAVWVSFNASLVTIGPGKPLYLLAQVEDISERKRLEEQLRHLAQRDPLTGLFNRRRFEEELARQLAHVQRHGTCGAVVILDLDGFKATNDTHGHAAGDEALVTVAEVLNETLRRTDVPARLGGDEFGIILADTDVIGAQRVAHRLVTGIQSRMRREHEAVAPTASVGVAVYDASSASDQAVLAIADRAMYEAKRSGGNRCVVAPALQTAS